MSHRIRRPATVAAAAAVLSLAALAGATPIFAHAGHEVGAYVLEIGWLFEPTYVGQPNAVQVTVTNHADGKPVLDLAADDLAVIVSTAGVDSPSLSFEPAFDSVEMEGSLGEYDAAIVPTAPGDYSFHVTGSIHGTPVDLTVASGDETFNAVVGSSDLEFPAKLPTLAEVGTRLDRIDGRIADLQSAAPGGGDSEALDAANAATDAARAAQGAADAANRNAQLGFLVGIVGIVLALWSRRARRTA